MVFFEPSRRLPLLRRVGAVLGAIRRIDFTEHNHEWDWSVEITRNSAPWVSRSCDRHRIGERQSCGGRRGGGARARRSRPEMAPQRLEKIESAPGNGMGSGASNLQDLVRGPAADDKRLRLRGRENDKVGKLQKKVPNVLKRLDAELKSAPAAVLRTPGHAHPARPRTVASKGRIFEARRDGRADA